MTSCKNNMNKSMITGHNIAKIILKRLNKNIIHELLPPNARSLRTSQIVLPKVKMPGRNLCEDTCQLLRRRHLRMAACGTMPRQHDIGCFGFAKATSVARRFTVSKLGF